MNPWQAHDEARGHAVNEMRDLVDLLLHVKEKAQEVAGIVATVTGGELCPNENGRASFEHIARTPEMVDEVAQAVNQSIEQMSRYIF